MHSFRRHLTYANVVATLALFLVLAGGSAVAASKLIDGSRLRNESVTGMKIRNGSVQLADLSPAARKALRGAKGERGADGAAGAAGRDGTNGTNGTNGTDGAPGTAGAIGPKGDAGATGPQGAAGTPVAHADDLNAVPCRPSGGTQFGGHLGVGVQVGNTVVLTCTPWGLPEAQPDELLLATYGPNGDGDYVVPVADLLANDIFPDIDIAPDAPRSVSTLAGDLQCGGNCLSAALVGTNIVVTPSFPNQELAFYYIAKVTHYDVDYADRMSPGAFVALR